MPVQTLDKFPNMLYADNLESGANTLTFKEITIGLNIFDKVGIIIHRLEFYNWQVLLLAVGDILEWGLSSSNGWTTVVPSETSIIMYHRKQIADYGTAGNNKIFTTPLVDDFSTLPGGGLLITPKPLYMFSKGAALGSASTVKMRMFFTVMKMKPEDYFELLEARNYFG